MSENSNFEQGGQDVRPEDLSKEADDGVYPEIKERESNERVEDLKKEYDKAMGRAIALESEFFGEVKGCMTKNFDKNEDFKQSVCDPMMEWSRANNALRTSKNPDDQIKWYTAMIAFWNARAARAQELLDREGQGKEEK